jgi:hypothetical protein
MRAPHLYPDPIHTHYLLFLLIILWHVYPDPPRLNDPEPTFDALFV